MCTPEYRHLQVSSLACNARISCESWRPKVHTIRRNRVKPKTCHQHLKPQVLLRTQRHSIRMINLSLGIILWVWASSTQFDGLNMQVTYAISTQTHNHMHAHTHTGQLKWSIWGLSVSSDERLCQLHMWLHLQRADCSVSRLYKPTSWCTCIMIIDVLTAWPASSITIEYADSWCTCFMTCWLLHEPASSMSGQLGAPAQWYVQIRSFQAHGSESVIFIKLPRRRTG